MSYEFDKAICEFLNAIKRYYYDFTSRKGTRELTDVNKRMIDEFNAGLSIQEGKKYVKIVSNNSVWGFIVKVSEDKFRAGDILKAASWASPAKNSARGNIYENYSIAWTGPHYLRG